MHNAESREYISLEVDVNRQLLKHDEPRSRGLATLRALPNRNGVDQNREKGGGRVAYFQAHLQAKHAFLVVVMLFDGGETHARWDVMWFKGESP